MTPHKLCDSTGLKTGQVWCLLGSDAEHPHKKGPLIFESPDAASVG